MISENLGLDEIDRRIVKIVQENPLQTHTKIAKQVRRSQPTVGMRIRKLQELGILQYQAGFNLRSCNLFLAKIDVQSSKSLEVKEIINRCPHVIHAFRLSGLNDFIIIIAATSVKDLDKVVNYHFRNNPIITKVSMEIITETFQDFVVPIDSMDLECDCTK